MIFNSIFMILRLKNQRKKFGGIAKSAVRFRLCCVEVAVMQYSCLCYNYIKEDEKKAKRYKNSIKKIQKKRGIVYEEEKFE